MGYLKIPIPNKFDYNKISRDHLLLYKQSLNQATKKIAGYEQNTKFSIVAIWHQYLDHMCTNLNTMKVRYTINQFKILLKIFKAFNYLCYQFYLQYKTVINMVRGRVIVYTCFNILVAYEKFLYKFNILFNVITHQVGSFTGYPILMNQSLVGEVDYTKKFTIKKLY